MLHRLSKQAALEAACVQLVAANAPQLPLVRAVADGRIEVIGILDPNTPWPAAQIVHSPLPTVILIGADTDTIQPGAPPEHWKCREDLRVWARAAIVHGASGERRHYESAVTIVETVGRLAFIECASHHVPAWVSHLRCERTVMIVPGDGPHPAPASRSSMR